jgi:serine/threonine-protein kinase
MSPEQARGERVDHRSDLYAFGLVLYEMLTGRGPFDGGEHEPPAPSNYVADEIAPALDDLLRRALCVDPEQRFQSAAALRRALDEMAPPVSRRRSSASPGSPNPRSS